MEDQEGGSLLLAAQCLFIVAVCTATVALLDFVVGPPMVGLPVYLFCAAVAHIPLIALFTSRWASAGQSENLKKASQLAMVWPVTILLLPWIVRREEKERRNNLAREVMES